MLSQSIKRGFPPFINLFQREGKSFNGNNYYTEITREEDNDISLFDLIVNKMKSSHKKNNPSNCFNPNCRSNIFRFINCNSCNYNYCINCLKKCEKCLKLFCSTCQYTSENMNENIFTDDDVIECSQCSTYNI